MATGQKTEFTIDAKDKTKKGLLSAQKNLKKTGKEANKLASNFRNVARATVVMEGPLGGTAGRLSAVATMLGNVSLGAVALGAGFTAMTAVGYKSLKMFARWESQNLKINQLLEQTGGASGLAAFEIEDMAVRIGRATLSSADDVRSASAVLLSFKSIATDSFERTLDVASDLAALTGQDLKQSVIQLGKALDDPATGMSALRRVGVSFTDSQKEMIVTMNKTGDVAGAQSEILKLLEGQLGGAGAAAGEGLSGAADLVTENWSLMLIKMAESGAGTAATKMLNELGMVLQWVGHLIDPDPLIRLVEINQDLRATMKEVNDEVDRGGASTAFMGAKGAQIRLLREEKAEIEATLELKKKDVETARAQGRAAQEEIKKQKVVEAELAAQRKTIKAEEKQFDKEKKTAGDYGQKLIDQEQKLQTSLLTKGQQEDIYLEERLMKLDENLANGLISKEQAHAAEQAAFSIHNTKLTEISRTEKEKQEEDDAKLQKMQVAATQTALGDIGTLMASSSKKLFKLGQAAAIANSLINTYQAVTKTMASVPYPFNIPLAVAQGVAGMVQVQKIKQQKMAAKEHGGSVIGGRTYLVGERGPELFTPPNSGNIVNNKSISNTGGQSNVFNITNVLENDEAFIQRNTVKIWDSILDRMNEEGMRFA